MGIGTQLPSLDSLKSQAKRLRQALSADGQDLIHSQALELVARQYGYRDWNTLHAALGNRPQEKFHVGQRVMGKYLKQDFEGEVIGLRKLGDGRHRITVQFDAPVDVVAFESFSALRQRVNAVIGNDGVSPEKTSDGTPHLTLRLADS